MKAMLQWHGGAQLCQPGMRCWASLPRVGHASKAGRVSVCRDCVKAVCRLRPTASVIRCDWAGDRAQAPMYTDAKRAARRVGFLTDIDVYAGLRWTTALLSEEMAIDMKAENGDDPTLNGHDATVVRCPECGSKDVR